MSWIRNPLREWHCADPDEVGSPEYRVLYDRLLRRLASSMMANPNTQGDEVALASLREFVSHAERLRNRILTATGKVASLETRGRVQILNWRKHGDDESFCRIEVFGIDDAAETQCLVEKEYDVRRDAEDEGDYAAVYYVNDDITLADGDIMTSHDGRRYRLGIVLAT